MHSQLALSFPWSRHRFWLGEPVIVGVEVTHCAGAAPVRLPSTLSYPEGWAELRLTRDGQQVPIDAGLASGRRPQSSLASRTVVNLIAFGSQTYELCLSDWHVFEAGKYSLQISAELPGMEISSAHVEFVIFAAESMQLLAFDAQPGDGAVNTLVAVSGRSEGVVLEQVFPESLDVEGDLVVRRGRVRHVHDAPIVSLLRVPAASDSESQWILWRDPSGLCARYGTVASGLSRFELPTADSAVLADRAHVAQDGRLELLALSAAGNESVLQCIEFKLPVVEIEDPTGPDDWDDEILVAGPAGSRVLGEVAIARPCCAVAVDNRAAIPDLLVLDASMDRCQLHLIRDIDERGQGSKLILLAEVSGVPVPHARPVVIDGAAGRRVLFLVFRPGVADVPCTDVVAIFVPLVAAPGNQIEERVLATLAKPPVSAAVVSSGFDATQGRWLGAVLDTDGILHGGPGVAWSVVSGVSSIVEPLSLVTYGSFGYVVCSSPAGPILHRCFDAVNVP